MKRACLLEYTVCLFVFTLSYVRLTGSVELTFELPDSAKECFHEVIEKDTEATLEYQVVTGGHYDVDVEIRDPMKNVLYKEVKKQYDSFQWKAERTGEFIACFSNEFSTFSHKLVYIDFQVGDEDPLPGLENQMEPLTQMETSSREIHENLNSVIDFQTHHRLRETQGRKRGEDLNERVMIWSIFVTIAIMFVGLGQVFVLKSFFSDKKPSQMYAGLR